EHAFTEVGVDVGDEGLAARVGRGDVRLEARPSRGEQVTSLRRALLVDGSRLRAPELEARPRTGGDLDSEPAVRRKGRTEDVFGVLGCVEPGTERRRAPPAAEDERRAVAEEA